MIAEPVKKKTLRSRARRDCWILVVPTFGRTALSAAQVGWTSARECGFPTQVIAHTKLGAMPQREATKDNCVCSGASTLISPTHTPSCPPSPRQVPRDVMLAFVPEPRCTLSASPKNAPAPTCADRWSPDPSSGPPACAPPYVFYAGRAGVRVQPPLSARPAC